VSPLRGVIVPAAELDHVRAHEDLNLLAELGAAFVRIGLDWSRLQPSAGSVDGDAIEFYLGLTQTARGLGLPIQFTLLEKAVPKWFDNEGGFTDQKWALHWWPRWVELCADTFGDHIDGWTPIDHPLGIANGLVRDDPRRHGEVLETLLLSWRDAWRILRGGPAVSTSFGLEIVRPVDQTIPAEHNAKRLDAIRWRLWLQALRDGVVSIPGRADREVADLAGACDVIGLVVRHERDTLALLHRAAEQAPDRPLSATILLPSGPDSAREPALGHFLDQTSEAASGMPLAAISINPVFDADASGRGIINRERELKDSGRAYFGRD
jgi:hypothetical protein